MKPRSLSFACTLLAGVIGCIQALEVIKLAGEMPDTESLSGRLLIFDAMSCKFVNVKLRPRNSACAVCGDARPCHLAMPTCRD